MVFAVYTSGNDDIVNQAQLRENVSDSSRQTAEDKPIKQANPVLTVRGAKLAAGDKNPVDPFNPAHLSEKQEKIQVNAEQKGQCNSGADRTLAGKTQIVQQVNNGSVAVESASPVGKNDKLPKENKDILELAGIMLSDYCNMALLNWHGSQFALGVGETKEGITLVSVTKDSAVILWGEKEQVLRIK